MLKKFLVLFGALVFSVSAWALPLKIMVFGDSLSVGYNLSDEDAFYFQLEKALQSDGFDVEVWDYSKTGETSAGGVSKVDNAIEMQADVVLLELGINDALHGIDIATTQQNLQTIIDKFINADIPVLLIGMEAPVLMELAYRDAFKKMYRNLAQENHVVLYPFFMKGLWKTNGAHENLDYFLSDLVHPSAEGVEIMTKNILPTVKEFLSTYKK